MTYWTHLARRHWQTHLPERYAALNGPDTFFAQLGQHAAARYEAIRDSLLEGVNPNDGTIGWNEFQDRVAKADQIAREIVAHDLIQLPKKCTPARSEAPA